MKYRNFILELLDRATVRQYSRSFSYDNKDIIDEVKEFVDLLNHPCMDKDIPDTDLDFFTCNSEFKQVEINLKKDMTPDDLRAADGHHLRGIFNPPPTVEEPIESPKKATRRQKRVE